LNTEIIIVFLLLKFFVEEEEEEGRWAADMMTAQKNLRNFLNFYRKHCMVTIYKYILVFYYDVFENDDRMMTEMMTNIN
jgi:hypothetical protein